MRFLTLLAILLISCTGGACGDQSSLSQPQLSPVDPATLPESPPETIGEERVAQLLVPTNYNKSNSYPLVIMLHGYSATGDAQNFVFQLKERVDAYNFVLVIPEGTTDSEGKQFWNATPECCDFDNTNVDDVGYLTELANEARHVTNINVDQIGFVGHSNGGYMSYRMACEKPALVDRIVVLAGSTFIDPDMCKSPFPTSVLHIHGTADNIVSYETEQDASSNISTIGAEAAIDRWRQRARCEPVPSSTSTADLYKPTEGEETEITTWRNCDSDEYTELWKINGGGHIMLATTPAFKDGIAEWLTQP